ncbi:hypothetical protein bpr_II292 (plasmid) [Butyrivibrio proteoclasticus B316]|uniref:Uncharacterized protein n=1 Tax=Butyrivibrio proteoclasticus (strain ATCC 51982 / DSM 14932 / B316) TaxID=515622 RepID=E0S497_BUTPB|nr:hypothetical protein [Butyrivibrio proteoclasticus]ADL36229.1 hypothetical protein bpr_II292 [Butyrivibrio proteoclasticus B316]
MRIRIRIYADREPDLYALYEAAGPSLTRKIFKQAISSYLTGEKYDIRVSGAVFNPVYGVQNPMFDISVAPQFDAELDKLPDRSISAFAKTLVRFYAFKDIVAAYGLNKTVVYDNGQAINDIAPVIPQKKERPKETAPIKSVEEKPKEVENQIEESKEAPKEDIDEVNNSDLNSLASLFSGLKMV